MALRLMKALGGGGEDRLILNVRNRNAVAEMPADAVVEVPCVVDRNGARPLAVGAVEPHFLALMRQVKTVERAAITAATTRSRAHALLALVSHPLVDSAAAAERALDGYAAAFPELADLA
nr:hypothetical protein GCM10020241_12880 [Streptoalloteichus tenebrarius]